MAKLLVFDLDGTLYLETNGYPQHCRRRAAEYLADKFDMTVEEAEAKRKLALKVRTMRERAREGERRGVREYSESDTRSPTLRRRIKR